MEVPRTQGCIYIMRGVQLGDPRGDVLVLATDRGGRGKSQVGELPSLEVVEA